jgi:ferric-dicitrate binding protein FerR (iron transport regulator)
MNKENKKEISYKLLKQYFYGETTEDETRRVKNWLMDPANKFRADQFLKMLWEETAEVNQISSFDQKGVLDKIHHTINLQQEKKSSTAFPSGKKPGITIQHIFRQSARVAAILLLPVMMYLAWEVISQKLWLDSQKEVVYNEIVCPLGARSRFELPDGTTGSLNNGSRLKYPVKFHGDIREVKLEGEAYFDVKHNKKRPFVIKTHGLDVKVTGTSLNVYSYPEDQYQEFTLKKGTIELLKKEGRRSVSIAEMKKPGQHAVYKLNKAKVDIKQKRDRKKITRKVDDNMKKLKSAVSQMKSDEKVIYETDEGKVEFQIKKDVDKYTSWKEGMLVLRNDPMPLLLKRIERWYNVKFNVLDEGIDEYTYWATFEEENLDQVLKLLSLTGPIEFKKHPREKNDEGVYEPQVIDVMLERDK